MRLEDYFNHNRPHMDAYLADWLERGYGVREEQRQNPPALVASLAALREEEEKYRHRIAYLPA